MILISVGLLVALLLTVHGFLILILPLLLGTISEEGLLHFLEGEGCRLLLVCKKVSLKREKILC
jgi:hypothetical protein